jgi:hypothetical protein
MAKHPINDCLLPGPARQFACGTIATPNIGGQTNATRSGFVNIIMVVKTGAGQPKYIRVGNKSSPWYNNGVYIKEFNFGGENDAKGDFTIYDSTGNDLSIFLTALYEDSCKSKTNNILVDFGYIFQSIDNQPKMRGTSGFIEDQYKAFRRGGYSPPVNQTPPGLNAGGNINQQNWLGFVVNKIDVSSDGAGWVYKVSLSSLLDRRSSRKLLAKAYGSSNGLMSLKDAAAQAVNDGCGTENVSGQTYFIREDTPGVYSEIKFKNSEGGANGPKNVWDPNRLPCVSAVRNWLNSISTDRDLGVTLYTDPIIDAPNLIVMEAPADICSVPNGAYCPGKKSGPRKIYLVNAGDCSPVIDFKPTVQYSTQARGQGGSSGGATSSKMVSFAGKNPCRKLNGDLPENQEGIATNAAIPSSNTNFRFPSTAADEEVKGISAQMLANAGRIQTSLIQGDLTIQGDPEYVSVTKCQGLQVGIIYINSPGVASKERYYYADDWLSNPPVNPVFSRLDYQITGVSHAIKEDGTYVTTLKVFAVPDQAKPKAKTRN